MKYMHYSMLLILKKRVRINYSIPFLLLVIAFLFSTSSALAQWKPVGSAGIASPYAYYTSLAISPDGTPYIGYYNSPNFNLMVFKYDGTTWTSTGQITGAYTRPSLAIAPDGTPYIAGLSLGFFEYTGVPAVQMYKDGVWKTLKNVDPTSWYGYYISLAISPDGTPYVAYQNGTNNYSPTVKKYNGSSWVKVGAPGFSTGKVGNLSLAIGADKTPYIGYLDSANGNRATVMKFNGTAWVPVGQAGFSAGEAKYVSLAISPNGAPYIAYSDGGNGYKATVMKYNGSAWMPVWVPGFSAGEAKYTSLAIGKDGTPYLAYTDVANGSLATVVKFTGTYWASVGKPGLSAGSSSYTSLAINAGGTPLVGYSDYVNSSKATVMVYDSLTAGPFTSPLCTGSIAVLPFSFYGNYNSNTKFTAQLSNAQGSFSNPVAIGSLAYNSAGNKGIARCKITIPNNTTPGTKYRVRVVADTPFIISAGDNGTDLSIGVSGAVYYRDSDSDGYGTPNVTSVTCNQPAGYVANNLDCNDKKAINNPKTEWVMDADKDGYYIGDPVIQCIFPGKGYVVRTTQLAGDCDDNNPDAHTSNIYYADEDRDGYGAISSPPVVLCAETAPVGYSVNNTDCNDQDANNHSNYTYYIDADKDGYGSATQVMLCSSTAPPGYATNNADCDDNDSNLHSGSIFFVDADGDGFGDPNKGYLLCSTVAPPGYADNGNDCNDNDATVHSFSNFYLDQDHDGYGSSSPIPLCASTPPPGFSANNDDCDDYDAQIHSRINYYKDADGDGYGSNTANPTPQCSYSAPAGYSANNLDCDDGNRLVHPHAIELNDGIDNDCDGQIDEDFIKLAIRDTSFNEGNSGKKLVHFPVTLSKASGTAVTVNYTTQNGTADNTDYIPQTGTLTIPAGSKSASIDVYVLGDNIKEPDETFTVVLSNLKNATFSRSSATGTIINDDGAVKLAFDKVNDRYINSENKQTLILNPIPATSELKVQMSGFEGKILLQVYNSTGISLKLQETFSAQSIIDVSKLAAGSYLLMVSDEKGNRKTQTFLVSR